MRLRTMKTPNIIKLKNEHEIKDYSCQEIMVPRIVSYTLKKVCN